MKRSIITIMALCIVACSDDAEAKEPVASIIQSTPKVVIVKNTETISYHLYRQAWRKLNNKPQHEWEPITATTPVTGKDTDHKTVELFLSELSFKDAFRLQFLGKGEGHTFLWRGREYTTDLLDVVRQPDIHQEDDVRDGGGDQGTIGE